MEKKRARKSIKGREGSTFSISRQIRAYLPLERGCFYGKIRREKVSKQTNSLLGFPLLPFGQRRRRHCQTPYIFLLPSLPPFFLPPFPVYGKRGRKEGKRTRLERGESLFQTSISYFGLGKKRRGKGGRWRQKNPSSLLLLLHFFPFPIRLLYIRGSVSFLPFPEFFSSEIEANGAENTIFPSLPPFLTRLEAN